MIADEEQARRLAEFLVPHGATPEHLLADVDESFGAPLLVVATGSILHGFGNSRSDVDLNVVVDHDRLSALSFPSFERGVLLDTLYFDAAHVERWADARRDPSWPPASLTRDEWRQRMAELTSAVRFAHGLTLRARDGWHAWREELRRPWFADRVVDWWRVEAIRRAFAGRWLAAEKPLLSAQRWSEAVLASLEARAAAAGELFFGTKWLPEKLRKLDDENGEAALRTALGPPVDGRYASAYAASCERVLREQLDEPNGLGVQLWLAPGVTARTVRGSTVVSRHDLRAIEVDTASLPGAETAEPIWAGMLDETPPAGVLALFTADMTWTSIVARAA